ncbi:hypothetical protein [Pseudomonas sp. zjy_8]|uniref:hypothetical protein n=1 Tax=Pseudomonas sp. GLN_2 TaxID=3367180 RepID=UPI00370B5B18
MSDPTLTQGARASMLKFQFCYTTVLEAVDAQYDVRGYLLSQLVKICLENRAIIPPAQRSYYDCCVHQNALAYLEDFTAQLLFGPGGRFSPHEYRYMVEKKL